LNSVIAAWNAAFCSAVSATLFTTRVGVSAANDPVVPVSEIAIAAVITELTLVILFIVVPTLKLEIVIFVITARDNYRTQNANLGKAILRKCLEI
jgi:hypothetical protein